LYVNNVHDTVFSVLTLPRLSVTVAVATIVPVAEMAPVVPTMLEVFVYVVELNTTLYEEMELDFTPAAPFMVNWILLRFCAKLFVPKARFATAATVSAAVTLENVGIIVVPTFAVAFAL